MTVALVWLEWPEKCFRVDAEALLALRKLLPEGSELLRARTETAFLRLLPRATHVITWHFKAEWYARAKALKVLATPGAGRELVDASAAPQGVRVHFGGYHGAIISETVAGFILAWARGFFRPELAAADSDGRAWAQSWPRSAIGGECYRVAGTKAVIVGYGKIGRAIGAKLEALGVGVEGFSRGNIAELPKVLDGASWFILALPSDTGTDNFLDAKLIAKLPRKCVVVNIGRGNAIDEEALLKALESGRIAGAYLDVFHNEPGPLAKVGGNSKGILSRPKAHLPQNLVRMPHSSAFSGDYLKICFKELKDDGFI